MYQSKIKAIFLAIQKTSAPVEFEPKTVVLTKTKNIENQVVKSDRNDTSTEKAANRVGQVIHLPDFTHAIAVADFGES